MDKPGDEASWGFEFKFDPKSDIDETAQRNRRTVIAAHEAMRAGDLETFFAMFDPDVEFYEARSLPYGCSVKGLAAARKGVDAMLATWSRLYMEIENFTAAGDIVLGYYRLINTSKATGKVYDAPVAELFRFRNGKVVEWRALYWDTHEVREVCGLE